MGIHLPGKTVLILKRGPCFYCCRVDPDSQLHTDLTAYKEKEGKDHIQLNFTYKVHVIYEMGKQ